MKVLFWTIAVVTCIVFGVWYFGNKPEPMPAVPADATTFTDASGMFRFIYPVAFVRTSGGVDQTPDWKVGSTTLGTLLAAVTISGDFQPKTNFSDARFTVGASVATGTIATCLTEGNGGPASSTSVMIGGTQFSKIEMSDAGAGNRYETTSYRTVHDGQCYAIEYTIHSTNIDNYSPEAGITEFDKAKVEGVLEGMVQSFQFLK
jgi:hypothetical protein